VERLVEAAPVGEAGEGVERREALELAVLLLELPLRLVELEVGVLYVLRIALELAVLVGERVEVVPGALGQRAEEGEEGLAVLGDVLEVLGLGDLEHERGSEGAERRRSLLPLDEGHLPEVLAGAAERDPLPLLADLDVPGEHHVERASLLALLEDALPSVEPDLGALVEEAAQVAVRQRAEELRAPQQRQLRLEFHCRPHLSLGSVQSRGERSTGPGFPPHTALGQGVAHRLESDGTTTWR
jgi:hypothetical protein